MHLPAARPVVIACPLLALLVGAACPREQPFFSSDLGVEAIPAEPGAHAGTFALKTTNVTQIEVPGIEPLEGGGENFRLVMRVYIEDQDVYEQESQLCGGFNYAVAGVVTESPQSTYKAVPRSSRERVVISAEGAYSAEGHLQLWALRNLPDDFETPLPDDRDEASAAPWTDRIYDMDGDDQPGFTLVVGGNLGSGQIYVVQRKTVDLEGIILGPDRAIGLAQNKNETLTLGASNPIIDRDSEGSAAPHPDPRKSYFEEARLADGATCDDVMSAIDDGVLHDIRPF
jgi:hypothetical protein